MSSPTIVHGDDTCCGLTNLPAEVRQMIWATVIENADYKSTRSSCGKIFYVTKVLPVMFASRFIRKEINPTSHSYAVIAMADQNTIAQNYELEDKHLIVVYRGDIVGGGRCTFIKDSPQTEKAKAETYRLFPKAAHIRHQTQTTIVQLLDHGCAVELKAHILVALCVVSTLITIFSSKQHDYDLGCAKLGIKYLLEKFGEVELDLLNLNAFDIFARTSGNTQSAGQSSATTAGESPDRDCGDPSPERETPSTVRYGCNLFVPWGSCREFQESMCDQYVKFQPGYRLCPGNARHPERAKSEDPLRCCQYADTDIDIIHNHVGYIESDEEYDFTIVDPRALQ